MKGTSRGRKRKGEMYKGDEKEISNEKLDKKTQNEEKKG